MSASKQLIKRLASDDALVQKLVGEPTREGKHAVIEGAGLEVPDHHDVLTTIAGGNVVSWVSTPGVASSAAASAL